MEEENKVEHLKGYTFLTGGVLLWSTIEVSSKFLSSSITPIGIAVIRFFLSIFILLPLCVGRCFKKKSLLIKIKSEMITLFALGMVGITGTFLLYHISLLYIPASTAAIVVSSVPIFVAPMTHFLYGELFTLKRVIGVAGGFLGLLILLISGEGFAMSPLGYSMIIGATILFSIYTALSYPVISRIGSISFTTITILFGLLGFFLYLIFTPDRSFFIAKPTPSSIVILLYLGLVVTGCGYFLYFLGLSKVIRPGAGSSLLFLKPPTAALLAILILGESIVPEVVLSMFIIIISLYLVIFSSSPKYKVRRGKR